MIAVALQLAAFYLLAASMASHRRALLGARHHVVPARRVAVAGWLILAVSFCVAIAAPRPAALVAWFGMLPLSAGIVLLGLTYSPIVLRGAVLAAAGFAIMLAMARP